MTDHRPFRMVWASLALSLALTTPAAAHDMWMEPSIFLADAGEIVSIRLRVGQGLIGDPIPRDPRLVKDFVVVEGGLRKPVVGRDGGDPAGFVRAGSPGLLIVGYQSHPSVVELTADKFNQYVKEEGLEGVGAARARQNQSRQSARDLFTRCAKTLILAGAASPGTTSDRQLGFELELVAERSPYGSTGDVPIRLLFRDRPLAGARVVAINRLHPMETMTGRTDASGRVRFRFAPGGMWLVKAVHMVPASDRTKADWASYWASLTFAPEAAASPTHQP
jgi:uncharacterized GH25 family protein